jgi:DNA-binding GntR family transcriptional regulator
LAMFVTRAYEKLRDLLRDEIISGKIAANSRLTIAEIANRYEVSQMPVREAFQWLQGEGLIKILPHKGARVLSLDMNYVRNIYEIRAAIEGMLTRVSVGYLKTEDISQLESIHKKMIHAAETGNLGELYSLNRAFHQTIYRHSDNTEAQEIYERYTGLLGTLRRKLGFEQGRIKEMMQEHAEILRSIKSKKTNGIEQLVRIHTEGAMNDILVLMKKLEINESRGQAKMKAHSSIAMRRSKTTREPGRIIRSNPK